ncbi:HalOD1 output domain-containing protein [Salinarchaeum chitinilyticum]
MTDRPLASTTVEDSSSTSVAVCELVSRVSDTPVRDLPPLEAAIDADCLNGVFSGESADGHLSFQFAGYDVVARSSDTVEVYTEATVTT